MDIAGFQLQSAASEGSDMPVVNPFTGEDTGATLRVLGFDSEAVMEAARAVGQKKMARDDVAGSLKAMSVARACAAVVGWSDDFACGKIKDHSPENVAKILNDPEYFWLVEQIQAHGADRGNLAPGTTPG